METNCECICLYAVYLAISGSKGPGVPPYFLAESPSFLRISGQVPRHPPPPPFLEDLNPLVYAGQKLSFIRLRAHVQSII